MKIFKIFALLILYLSKFLLALIIFPSCCKFRHFSPRGTIKDNLRISQNVHCKSLAKFSSETTDYIQKIFLLIRVCIFLDLLCLLFTYLVFCFIWISIPFVLTKIVEFSCTINCPCLVHIHLNLNQSSRRLHKCILLTPELREFSFNNFKCCAVLLNILNT